MQKLNGPSVTSTCKNYSSIIATGFSHIIPIFARKLISQSDNSFRHAVAGSPQACIDQLAMYERDYDVDYVVMRFRLARGPERERVLDCIGLFGEEVLPRFHR